jgi:hypothetical protein
VRPVCKNGTGDRPKANLRKFRGYSSDCQNQKYEAISGGFMADETVSCEPVCEENSLLTGKRTGKFEILARFGQNPPTKHTIFQMLAEKSPRKQNKELNTRNRERFVEEQGTPIDRSGPNQASRRARALSQDGLDSSDGLKRIRNERH